MHEVPVTEARAEFSELVSRVAYGGEPVVITRHGKPLVALVPAAYLDRLTTGTAGGGQSATEMTVLDMTARREESSGRFTVAAHHRDDPADR